MITDLTLEQKIEVAAEQIENSLELGLSSEKRQIRLILTQFANEIANGADTESEPSINYDGVLGTGLTAKDINGIEFGVGAIVSFNTYTPDKMNTVRKVRIRNNELWAGEIPVAMLTGERRNLQVIT